MTRLSDHLAVAPDKRDMAWLLTSLQSAVELEHATLPLYLSAMFSLQVQGYTVYNLLRDVHRSRPAGLLAPRYRNLNAS